MMPSAKRSKPGTPTKKSGGMKSNNALPFNPAPIKYAAGGEHTRQGDTSMKEEERGTGKN
jgi:hypothetical protein